MSKQRCKIGMVSLGCPKNQVDAEQMLGVLARQGFEITPEQDQADVLVGDADLAMYQAEGAGGNCYVLAGPSGMHEEAVLGRQ